MSGRGMYKTKLCILYEKRGQCSRPDCTFAHGVSELRRPEISSFLDKRGQFNNDLRYKLERRFSLERRHSSGRSGRGLQRLSGNDSYRPFKKRRESQNLDDRDDYAGGSRAGNKNADQAEDNINKFPDYNNALEDQLKDIEHDIKMLGNDKLQIRASIEQMDQETDILTSRIQELVTQLEREREDCRRITSSMMKFVKEYKRFSRAQDDVKRSQARLQKLGSHLSTNLAGSESNDRDTEIDIVNDVENNVHHRSRIPRDSHNHLLNTSSSPRKRHHVDQDTTEEPVKDGLLRRGGGEDKLENVKLKKPSRWNTEHLEKEPTEWINEEGAKQDQQKRHMISFGAQDRDIKTKGGGSPGMVNAAVDEVTEIEEGNPQVTSEAAVGNAEAEACVGSLVSRNNHSQEEEDNVDGGGTDEFDISNVDVV